MDEWIPSPCIGVCELDPEAAICKGCLRTIQEITRWSSLTPAEQSAVVAAVQAREEDPEFQALIAKWEQEARATPTRSARDG